MSRAVIELDSDGRAALAAALGDSPETVITLHLLRRGLCRAVVSGSPSRPRAAIIQSLTDPREPTAFGEGAAALWSLLRALDGWRCVNVPPAPAADLAALMGAALGRHCRRYDDLYFTLSGPATAAAHPDVRRLTPRDLPLLDGAEADFGTPGWNWGGAAALLREGIAAGAVIADRLVAIAFTGAISDRHADVGVATLPAWQRRGLATAAASLVVQAITAGGRTPVWSAGHDNHASLRVAAKLGFVETARRVYVIPE